MHEISNPVFLRNYISKVSSADNFTSHAKHNCLFIDDDNEDDSEEEDDDMPPTTEVRFAPADKGCCKYSSDGFSFTV